MAVIVGSSTMPESLKDASVLVIGGTSGIGLATAALAQGEGARVTVVGRDKDRLASALDTLGAGAAGATFDVADEDAVREFFDSVDHVDHVVTLAGTHANGTIAELPTDVLAGPVDNRFWGPVHVFKYAAPKMTDGSITICTGAGVARPRKGAAIVAAACSGSELLAQAMALELAPIRVNVIRPGIVDTPLLERMTGGNAAAMIAGMAKRIPVGRVATADDIADAIAFLMTNTYMDGAILTIDGGFSLA
jgi:NAD(P)-dependent dehydrogenase (short-subunit alcohol dehydrogenase family)